MLTAGDFTRFFSELHGYPPFRWQTRLAGEVIEAGRWPESISVPTGYGKTSVIEIAVFALAVNPALPRRTILVVDRRLVVDHAYDTAKRLEIALASPDGLSPTIRRVAATLAALSGEAPLTTAILRGGMYREPAWVRNPAQPMIICSTVDQVGSRLLHRGYGVSERMQSIHAGFLAHDTVCILDEAHISEPFRRTVASIQSFSTLSEETLPRPITLVSMSATLTTGTGANAFTLTPEDSNDPALERRRNARKIVSLEKASETNMANKLALEATRLGTRGNTILVVVNRVRRAREVAIRIAERDPEAHLLVITGRSRPVEREEFIGTYADRLFSGRDRENTHDEPPLYVVSTQAIEVGSDIDSDGLVTEACPLIPLLHRAARVDRIGIRGESRIVIVGNTALNKDTVTGAMDDPIYGMSLYNTWKLLRKLDAASPVDLGNAGWEKIAKSIDSRTWASLTPDQASSVVMTPAHCDLWVQTSPQPRFTPDPALFLHGRDYRSNEVQIIWRADLDPGDPESWVETVERYPPVAGEALSLPVYALRKLLRPGEDDVADRVSDLVVVPTTALTEDEDAAAWDAVPVLVWRGPERSFVTGDISQIRVGDTIVLCTATGGCDRWGWIPPGLGRPESEITRDIADTARQRTNRPVTLRVHPAIPEVWDALPGLHVDHEETAIAAIDSLLTRALEHPHSSTETVSTDIARLRKDRNRVINPHPSGTGWVITGRVPARASGATAGDHGMMRREPVSLAVHHARVARTVDAFARRIGLSEPIRDALVRSATLHDAGKADPREQCVYTGGNRVLAARGPLRAKSDRPIPSRAALRAVRTAAGLPDGFRHEILSAHLIEQSRVIGDDATDVDLIVHLIASHHGLCRPYPPAITDPAPREITVTCGDIEIHGSTDLVIDGLPFHHLERDSDRRFWRLIRRYGWWGLSYLEAVFRLADHRASGAEAAGETV